MRLGGRADWGWRPFDSERTWPRFSQPPSWRQRPINPPPIRPRALLSPSIPTTAASNYHHHLPPSPLPAEDFHRRFAQASNLLKGHWLSFWGDRWWGIVFWGEISENNVEQFREVLRESFTHQGRENVWSFSRWMNIFWWFYVLRRAGEQFFERNRWYVYIVWMIEEGILIIGKFFEKRE